MKVARRYISEFASAVEELATTKAIPPYLVLYLFSLSSHLNDVAWAKLISRHFAGLDPECMADGIDDDFERQLKELTPRAQSQFLEAIALFLVALSYCDWLHGHHTREALMGKQRQAVAKREAIGLAHRIPMSATSVNMQAASA
jgi:hypothetical protein